MTNYMNDDQWAEKFKPIQNTIDTNASWSGMMFETFGRELEAVRAADPDCVWTLVSAEGDDDAEEEDDCEGPRDIILKGYHHINRLGYFITELPAEADTPDEIEVVS